MIGSRNKLNVAPFLVAYCKRKRGSLARPGGDFGKPSARPGGGGISETVRLAPSDGVRRTCGRICGCRPRAKINKPTHPQLPRACPYDDCARRDRTDVGDENTRSVGRRWWWCGYVFFIEESARRPCEPEVAVGIRIKL